LSGINLWRHVLDCSGALLVTDNPVADDLDRQPEIDELSNFVGSAQRNKDVICQMRHCIRYSIDINAMLHCAHLV